MKNIFLVAIFSFSMIISCAQDDEEVIRKTFTFERPGPENVFYLANINGGIAVEGYSGNTIELEAVKRIKGKTRDRTREGMEALSLGVIDRLDTLIVYIKGPCGSLSYENSGSKGRGWCYQWNNCEDLRYDFKFDFTLKVPYNSNLYLSTVNKGDIKVENVKRSLDIHNVNGAITLENIEGQTYVSTINGDVILNYAKNPTKDSRYCTLNGDINAGFPGGLTARMSFKSYNGDFYTNVSSLEKLPVAVKAEEVADNQGIKYKIGGTTMMQIRNGSVLLDFETFNGDVIVREK